jgi:hypothetical protein
MTKGWKKSVVQIESQILGKRKFSIFKKILKRRILHMVKKRILENIPKTYNRYLPN